MTVGRVTRQDVLQFRFRQHQLDRPPGTPSGSAGVALLDFGVQDTGSDGAGWALAIRGAAPTDLAGLAFAWTLRGAPHAYRRSDLAEVATATAPLSEADATKRIFDAAKPLREAGIAALEALRVVAQHLREIVAAPTVKGDASRRLTQVLDQPYLRLCRPCGATHAYEMPFRLASLQAGLELDPGTSPPVLRRIPGVRPGLYRRLAGDALPQFDVIRNYLRFYGPARIRDVATFLDAVVKEVKAHWPGDAVEVAITDEAAARPEPRFMLPADVDALAPQGGHDQAQTVQLLAPYDPYLQLRDRELLVPEELHRKDLWRVLGRPGAIVADGEIAGTWRPSTSGRKLRVRIEQWRSLDRRERAGVEEQAARLAAHRGADVAEVVEA